MIRLKKRKPGFFEQVINANQILPATDRKKGLQFLVSFIDEIRPGSGKKKDAARNLQQAIEQIRNNRVLLANLQHALLSQISSTDLTAAITESGIPLARGFWQELSNRLKHKILPPLLDEDDFLYVIQTVFYRKNDFVWVEAIPRKTWLDFFTTAAFDFRMAGIEFRKELMQNENDAHQTPAFNCENSCSAQARSASEAEPGVARRSSTQKASAAPTLAVKVLSAVAAYSSRTRASAAV